MATKIVLNTPRYKGEFPFDIEDEPLTALEWRWIKKISDYLPLTIEDGWTGGDPALFVAFAVVALARAGRIMKEEALSVGEWLSESPFDGVSISLVVDEVGDEVPPPEPAVAPENGTSRSAIGLAGSLSSVPSDPDRSSIGSPA